MKTWKLVTVLAASLSAVAFSAACTVEEGTVEGSGGSAGTTTQPTAGTGGTPAVGGAAGSGGAAVVATASYADIFGEDDKPDGGPCTVCIKTNCAAANTACGNVAGQATTKGPCHAAAACVADGELAVPRPTRDCNFESCATAHLQDEVNVAFTCTAEKCGMQCGVTPGFTCP